MKHWWLYVLKLEQDKWYVGITSQTPEKRFKQHRNGFAGAKWTRNFEPIEIHFTKDLGICDYERAALFEARVTRKYMKTYGDNNVRGGDLTDTEEYSRHFGRIFLKKDFREGVWILLASIVLLYFAIEKILYR